MVSDFDRIDEHAPNQRCIGTYTDANSDALGSIVFRQIQKPSLRDMGKFEVKLISYGGHNIDFSNEDLVERLKSLFDYIKVSSSSSDLIVYITRSVNLSRPDPIKWFFRKNGDLISYKLVIYEGQDLGPMFKRAIKERYGYCWRE
ncbi:MAG: hypothetical protein HOP07_05650 [Bacteriovoracaceae bacterium]|nr:hypothetical protein [Bacteriovoracaceae bacterium]